MGKNKRRSLKALIHNKTIQQCSVKNIEMLAKYFFFIFIVNVVMVAGQSKPGDCPPLFNLGVCEVSCWSDVHCEGPFKCCPTACGGTLCVRPLRTISKIQGGEKEGQCPNPPTGPWVCSSRCSQDSDCRGRKKCCQNRCGAMACVNPEF